MNLTPVGNTVLITVERTLIDEIITDSGFKLYIAPEYNMEENISVTGKISHLPRNYEGALRVGDEVAFSYQVISDRSFPNTSELFTPVSEGNTNVRLWVNGKGEKVRMMAHQIGSHLEWVGTYFNSKGLFEYGSQGSEKVVENWMHRNFKFGTCDSYTFKNLIQFEGNNYWKCPIEKVFAKKSGKNLLSVSDRVICTMIDIDAKDVVKDIGRFRLPQQSIKLRYYDRGKVVTGGGFKKGKVVAFNPDYCEKYDLFGKKYFMIKQHRITGTWD